jgi:hypothetical protein
MTDVSENQTNADDLEQDSDQLFNDYRQVMNFIRLHPQRNTENGDAAC